MPFDVYEAYEYGDLASRTYYMHQVDSIMAKMYYADTLKEAARFLYETIDYDPIRYYVWGAGSPRFTYKQGNEPGYIGLQLQQRIQKIFPDSSRTADIIYAYYIADVIVDHTVEGVDSSTPYQKLHDVKVTCIVTDTIKGRVFPPCISDNDRSVKRVKHQGSATASVSGGCLQFEYTLEWNRLHNAGSDADIIGGDSTLGNYSTGARWIYPDSEYIVFLGFVRLGSDNSHIFCTLFPESVMGTCCGMYPVRGGYVYDPHNDFGFGTGLTV
ncbi:MAG TPA: hypothetical protein VFA55_03010, partial [Candidatus Kapabacteria bacterium]|nr:hypothetical protein [Candidatus Kapabacteria bacterium]